MIHSKCDSQLTRCYCDLISEAIIPSKYASFRDPFFLFVFSRIRRGGSDYQHEHHNPRQKATLIPDGYFN